MSKQTTAYIGLGSNLGEKRAAIDNAIGLLSQTGAVIVRVSDVIETLPVGNPGQPKYLNAVAEVKTELNADNLLQKLLEIETALGRVRKEKWSPRTIDLDLLLFGDEIINTPRLIVPHPQMHLRTFVLQGLCQLNPNLNHPVLKVSVRELAARLAGGDFFLDSKRPQLVSIAGVIGVGKTTLVKALAPLLAAKTIFEPYDTNPYLPEVYAGNHHLALDSQLYFLTARVSQLSPQSLPLRQIILTDYVFDKERIYADRLLDSRQLTLYEEIYRHLSPKVAAPVLAIYLKAPVEICADRIHSRNRSYEQRIDHAFLRALCDDYDRLFDNWKTSPLIRIDVSHFDSTKAAAIETLAAQIRAYVCT